MDMKIKVEVNGLVYDKRLTPRLPPAERRLTR